MSTIERGRAQVRRERIAELTDALQGLVEKYEEIVRDDNAARSLEDDALVKARAALTS